MKKGRMMDTNSENGFSILMIMSRAVGVLPCNRSFKYSFYWLLYSLLVNFLSISIRTYLRINLEGSNIFERRLKSLVSLSYMVSVFCHLVRIGSHKIVFEKVYSILKYTDSNFKLSNKWFYRCVIYLSFLYAINAWYYPGSAFRKIIYIPILLHPLFNFYLLILQLSDILELLALTFKRMADDLTNNDETIAFLIRNHKNMIGFTRLVNGFFSIQLVAIFTTICYIILDRGFYGYRNIVRISVEENLEYFIFSLLLIVGEIGGLFLLCNSCTRLTVSIDNFYSELFRLMLRRKGLYKNEKAYFYLLANKTIAISACGFFNVSNNIIPSVITASFTFLAILLPWSKKEYL